MQDNQYPPEWRDTPPPHPFDPRLGDVLDPYRPTAAQSALVTELVRAYVSRDTQTVDMYLDLGAESSTELGTSSELASFL